MQAVANRDALFRKILFEDANLGIHTPLWGDLIPKIPREVYNTNAGVGAFGLGAAPSSLGVGLGGGFGGGLGSAGTPGTGKSLADVARIAPTAALDAVFVELLADYGAKGLPIPADELDAFSRATNAMAALSSAVAPDGTAALVGAPATDSDLTKAVRSAGGVPASLSIGSAIGAAVNAVTDRLRKVGSALVVDPLADLARPWVGLFLGDVFTYLYHNGLREKIRAALREKLLAAHAALLPGEKLIIFGHSMGGVILVDMLCSPADAGLPADFKVDALLTVGSQPGLFQALGLFMPISVDKVPKPACPPYRLRLCLHRCLRTEGRGIRAHSACQSLSDGFLWRKLWLGRHEQSDDVNGGTGRAARLRCAAIRALSPAAARRRLDRAFHTDAADGAQRIFGAPVRQ